ncbi:predicted protein [Lichtheimia corymbifera JMRC:FSU:9682]|uniref:Uncharacterized protein n=1 Tax=Lichtheimia corymbifera JMRC:FSU:9682 TaxID=1263082 RepID=A0A068RIE2_9FUNG|nr:predicted protein [Lichtheimia corymbifera JMRC:FSU:9682]
MISKRITESECANMGNAYPICAPQTSDTWYQGNEYKFIWNYNFPYFISGQSQADSWLDLHLYFRENYAYQEIFHWDNLPLLDGSLTVTVNESWFPIPTNSPNQTWTLYGYYLPAGTNASQELVNTYSMFPRPFNFTAVQLGDGSSNGGSDNQGNSSHADSSSSSSDSDHLPGWAIAVIVIACVALAAVIAAIFAALWYFRRRRQNANAEAVNVSSTAAASSSPPPPPMSQANISSSNNNNDMGTNTANSSKPAIQGNDGESIYSSTPMMAAVAGTGMSSVRDSSTTDGSNASRARTSPPADTFRNLLQHYPDWKAVLPGQEEDHDEAQRRRLGEALLQRELEEEGAAVKQTDHRALAIQTVAPPHEPQESTAVVLERSPSSA